VAFFAPHALTGLAITRHTRRGEAPVRSRSTVPRSRPTSSSGRSSTTAWPPASG
jgi:hypothetical protein